MSGGESKVFCGNCGRELDERSDTPAEKREKCPVCGSIDRVVTKSGSSSTVRVTAASATAVAAAPKINVETVEADQSSEAEKIRGRFRATLDWYSLGDGLWMLNVLNERGDVVEGGVGDDPEQALLEVYERVLPP